MREHREGEVELWEEFKAASFRSTRDEGYYIYL